MAASYASVNTDNLNNLVAVIVGIAAATEGLTEILLNFVGWFTNKDDAEAWLFEWRDLQLKDDSVEDVFSKTPSRIGEKKLLSACICVGVGVAIGCSIFATTRDGVVLGGLGGLLSPFVHDVLQAGFQGKEILKRSNQPPGRAAPPAAPRPATASSAENQVIVTLHPVEVMQTLRVEVQATVAQLQRLCDAVDQHRADLLVGLPALTQKVQLAARTAVKYQGATPANVAAALADAQAALRAFSTRFAGDDSAGHFVDRFTAACVEVSSSDANASAARSAVESLSPIAGDLAAAALTALPAATDGARCQLALQALQALCDQASGAVHCTATFKHQLVRLQVATRYLRRRWWRVTVAGANNALPAEPEAVPPQDPTPAKS